MIPANFTNIRGFLAFKLWKLASSGCFTALTLERILNKKHIIIDVNEYHSWTYGYQIEHKLVFLSVMCI